MEALRLVLKSVILVTLRFDYTNNHSHKLYYIYLSIYKKFSSFTCFICLVILAAFKAKINGWHSGIYCTRGSFSKRIWWQGNFFHLRCGLVGQIQIAFVPSKLYLHIEMDEPSLVFINTNCLDQNFHRWLFSTPLTVE